MRLVDADRVDEVIIFDKNNENINVATIRKFCTQQKAFLDKFPTIEAVPITELKALQDYLYEEASNLLEGLNKLNGLIRKYEIKGE